MKENYLENSFHKQFPEIETITGPNSSEVSMSPERGGIITSLKFNGTEVLYLDEDTFNNTELNVKGGIPILFPNAGPLKENSDFPNLKQHGFARNAQWKSEYNTEGFREELISNQQSKEIYPYDFNTSLEGAFETEGSFTITQEVKNNEQNKELPIAMGLHPYFKVSNIEKENIRFNFPGGDKVEQQVGLWSQGKAVSIDNPKVLNSDAVLKIEIPGIGTLVIDPSIEYQKIWVWSLPEKDFICIEPVMRDVNGLIENPQLVQPGENFTVNCNIKLI